MATNEFSGRAGFERNWDRPAIFSRMLKILSVTAAAIVFANVVVGNPLVLFASAAASLVGPPAPQALTNDEIALFRKTAYQSETEIRERAAEILFRQFQAWAANEDRSHLASDCKADAAQAQPDVRAQIIQTARAEVRSQQPKRKARAEIRRTNHSRQVRRKQNSLHDWFAYNAPRRPGRHLAWF
jgi:hypothetical protein